ncbi:MAG: MotA/TolQ/ExbB proton channel family protein [Candidatus Coatesbacteria bacterium]|jgi:biopolymer transport protein ExbB/TolQ|nr:MotA/TolQ/ExbB proton channel family protein [Candidatus Coatesbacteria bacterium]
MDKLFTMFDKGGEFMYIILAVLVFSIAIMLERVYFVIFKSSLNTKTFIAELEKLIQSRNMERAIALCNTSNSALARVLREVVKNHSGSQRDMQVAADAKTLEVIPELEKRTSYLDMFSQIATLLGLLGTIAGLMDAFESLKVAAPDEAASKLADGISQAMLTTMFGLTVAVPTIVVASIIKNKTERIISDIDQYSVKISNLITATKG